MNKQELPQKDLIADMKATFPDLHARPGAEFGKSYSSAIWTGGEACMHDGVRIFDCWSGSEEHDGGVHKGFTAWLENRGWYLENYDGEAFLAFPISCAALPNYEMAKYEWTVSNPAASPEEYTAAMRRIADACGV